MIGNVSNASAARNIPVIKVNDPCPRCNPLATERERWAVEHGTDKHADQIAQCIITSLCWANLTTAQYRSILAILTNGIARDFPDEIAELGVALGLWPAYEGV